MRWIWLDRILELERSTRCVAIKCVSAAEEVLHDHFPADAVRDLPAQPCLPHTLVIEGFAQCAGILVGHANDFKEKVLLAKVGKAIFEPGVGVGPGHILRFEANVDRIDHAGAQTSGQVLIVDPATGKAQVFLTIEMMFAHADNNMQGLDLPEENFVFTELFFELLKRSGVELPA